MENTTGLHLKVLIMLSAIKLACRISFLLHSRHFRALCPSGHVDPGEDDLTTAWRETQEEAGLGQEHLRVVDGFLQKLHYQVRGKEKEVLYWLAELRDPSIKVKLSDEHQNYSWVKLDEACRLARYTDLQSTLKNAQHFLEKQWLLTSHWCVALIRLMLFSQTVYIEYAISFNFFIHVL